MSAAAIVPSICRNCPAFCPVLVTVADGRPVKVAGDPHTPYEGYTCPKGRAMAEQHTTPLRLLKSQKRRADGAFDPIERLLMVDEITDRLQGIIARHGPESVALYHGNGSLGEYFGPPMGAAFFRALGSPMVFAPSTIDKPAEHVALALHGNWPAGAHSFMSSDTWLIVGGNPVIAKSNGAPYHNPGMRLKEAVNAGLKLILIDPRRTETSKRAHVHLQARPGEDACILAAIIRVIIEEDLCDRTFVDENALGFEALKAATEPFTLDYVANRAGVPAEDLLEAARAFGRAKRGSAVASTGPSFSTRSNITFYLTLCLNTICGRWTKAGEPAPMPNVLLPAFLPRAQPQAPYPVFGERILPGSGMRENASGLPTAGLADAMLHEGEGRIRALISIGGNPMSAWPDERKTKRALSGLELLVQFDAQMSATARLADYIVASPMALEVPTTTYLGETLKYCNATRGFEIPWAQYAPAATPVPRGSDLILEHEVFFRMAQKMGLSLEWVNSYGHGSFVESPSQVTPLDMERVPTVDELWELVTVNSRLPLSEVKKHPHGVLFDAPVMVQPRAADCAEMLQLGDPLMMAELAAVLTDDWQSLDQEGQYPYRLVCRRTNNFMNSVLVGLPGLSRNKRHNPLHAHSSDIASLGLEEGDVVTISSRHGQIFGIIESDDSLRPGVVSMTHGFGGHGGETELDPWSGANVNLLISHEEADPISGIPRMSNIPVSLCQAKLARS